MPRRTLPAGTRERAVALVLKDGFTHQAAAKRVGCSTQAVSKWVRAEHGPTGPRPLSDATRGEVVRLAEQGVSHRQIAEQVEIAESTVFRTLQRHRRVQAQGERNQSEDQAKASRQASAKACAVCGKTFRPKTRPQWTCSERCLNEARRRRYEAAKASLNGEEVAIDRFLGSAKPHPANDEVPEDASGHRPSPRRWQVKCVECGVEVEGAAHNRRYCSQSCQQEAARKRSRERTASMRAPDRSERRDRQPQALETRQ